MPVNNDISSSAAKSYAGPIFDADTHIWEQDFSFMERYLPDALKKDWLVARKVGQGTLPASAQRPSCRK